MRLTLLYILSRRFSVAISQSPRPAARPRLPLSTGLAAESSAAKSRFSIERRAFRPRRRTERRLGRRQRFEHFGKLGDSVGREKMAGPVHGQRFSADSRRELLGRPGRNERVVV